jgi:hypothetical protein
MEQKQTAVEYLVEQLLPKALSAQQYYHIEQAKEMEKQQMIELPSDKEIKEYINSTPYYGHCTSEYCEGIEDGIKWVINKIQGGNQ